MNIDVWRGPFGDAYTARNHEQSGREQMFTEILKVLPWQPESILEVGANRGLNLDALAHLLPDADLIGLEPNAQAREQISCTAIDGAAQAIPLGDNSVDMAVTCGVLIHVPPEELGQACAEIYRVARKYIVCIEYFADKPEAIHYRGRDDLLWKQDFGKLYLDQFPDLTVLGCGFFWKPITGLDNTTWWAFSK